MNNIIRKFIKDHKGQSPIEYVIIIGLISIVVLSSLVLLGGKSIDGECIIIDPNLEGKIGNYNYEKNSDTGLVSIYKNISCKLGGWGEDPYKDDKEDGNDEIITEDPVNIEDAKELGFNFSKFFPNILLSFDASKFDTSKELIIPSRIKKNGKIHNVTSIGISAFYNKGLQEVKLPQGLKRIHINAFAGNNLKIVIIPKSVNTIHAGAFKYNKVLKSVTFEGSRTNTIASAFPPELKIPFNSEQITYERK